MKKVKHIKIFENFLITEDSGGVMNITESKLAEIIHEAFNAGDYFARTSETRVTMQTLFDHYKKELENGSADNPKFPYALHNNTMVKPKEEVLLSIGKDHYPFVRGVKYRKQTFGRGVYFSPMSIVNGRIEGFIYTPNNPPRITNYSGLKLEGWELYEDKK